MLHDSEQYEIFLCYYVVPKKRFEFENAFDRKYYKFINFY
jgi:hypothetical protein